MPAPRPNPFVVQSRSLVAADIGDPGAGMAPDDWPGSFVARMVPFLDARATAPEVVGSPADAVAWRLGRGAGLDVRLPDGSDPGEPPAW